jgi:hypothetical protein
MKKNTTKEQTQRRLRLNRETIQILEDPALLKRAQGEGQSDWCGGFSAGGLGCQIVTGSGGGC